MQSLPKPSCGCGCATEVERLRGLLDVLVQAMSNDSSEATASYTDPKAARITAARSRMAELGWGGLLKGAG